MLNALRRGGIRSESSLRQWFAEYESGRPDAYVQMIGPVAISRIRAAIVENDRSFLDLFEPGEAVRCSHCGGTGVEPVMFC
jgi:hypothetical protein